MHSLRIAVVAGTLLGSAGLIAPAASAMPTSGLAAISNQPADLQNIAWVCGPYRLVASQLLGALRSVRQ